MARPTGRIPTGTVTLVLGDVEGSVRLWEADAAAMAAATVRLDEIVSELTQRYDGARPLEQGEGDSFVLAFGGANEAVRCALDLQLAFAKEAWAGGLDLRVRMAVHTGDVRLRDESNYAGPAINRCARIRALAHGGQTLLSGATHDLVVEGLPDATALRGLGIHRLRDLARPERVYQLCHPDLTAEFPTLRSLSALPNNLPTQLTSFVGRAQELRDISSLLATARIVTLTGAGGCGKTRLALQAAAEIPDVYPDGLWWVDLGPVSDPHAVPSAIAAALGIAESPGEEVLPRLTEMVRERHLLIILDNCEHLIDACAEAATAILRAAPAVTILATSREPLGISGEVTMRVPSLPLPDDTAEPEAVARADAVRLFVERAALARPAFRLDASNAEPVLRICRQLDGIPLAIELAAARTRVLSPAQIADALTDRFRLLTGGARSALARQRTLEASVDWSFKLLTDEERMLLARLSVFAGSFSLEAVEEVCTDERVGRYAALEILTALADRSLIQTEEHEPGTRYRLLETIRAYARDRLDADGDTAAWRDRHLSYVVRLAADAEAGLKGATHAVTATALDAELSNVRAAIDWAMASERGEDAMRIVGALSFYWLVRGRHAETKRMILSILEAAPEADPRLRLQAMWAGILVSFTGDFDSAYRFATASETLAGAVGDDGMLGRALTWKGWCEFWMGIGPGIEDMRRGLALIRGTGDATQLARPLQFLATVQLFSGSIADGEATMEEAAAVASAAQNAPALAAIGFFHGAGLFYRGEWDRAEELFTRGVATARAIGYGMFESNSLWGLAQVALHRGSLDDAAELAERALRVGRDAGAPLAGSIASEGCGEVALARGDLEAARRHLESSRDVARAARLTFNVVVTEALLGRVAHAAGDFARARAHLEGAGTTSALYAYADAATLAWMAMLDRDEGDLVAAERNGHQALTRSVASASTLTTIDALDVVGGVSLDRGDALEATRILAASARLASSIGRVRLPFDRARFAADVARCEAMLGDGFAAAWAEGGRLSAEEAATYALRGHGERARPASGWESLTPAERQVVALVAQGLTNPQIAERLFVTRNTVKVHLSHVFAKLGCATRAEVAAEATRRGS